MEGAGTQGDRSPKSRQATTKWQPCVLLDKNLFPRTALWCYQSYFLTFVKPQNLWAKDNKKSAKFSFWRGSKSCFSVPPSNIVSLYRSRLQHGMCSFATVGQWQLNKILSATRQPSQHAGLFLRLLPASCEFAVASVCVIPSTIGPF